MKRTKGFGRPAGPVRARRRAGRGFGRGVIGLALLAVTASLASPAGAGRQRPPAARTAPGSRAPVDWLLTGATIVTMDRALDVYPNGALAIQGDTIAAVGPEAALERKYRPTRRLKLGGGIIIPGLINGHTHAPMTLFRGLGSDTNLQDWLEKYIFPAEAKNVSPDFVRAGTDLALVEMIRSGTTTFTDMYYYEDDIAQAAKRAGERGVLGETVLDFPAPDNKTPAQALAYTRRFLEHWRGDALIQAAVAPHSMYLCSAATLRQAAALAREFQAPLLIHLEETRKEVDDSIRDHRLTPAAYLDSLGVLGPNVVAAHCVWVDAADRQLLARRGVGCVYNPSSNWKLASGSAPVIALRAAGVAVGLGTDGAASNNNLDMLRELDLAAKAQKLATMDPTALPAPQALALATSEGARALHREKEIGSLEPDKKADFAYLSLDSAHAVPLYDVYAQVVYALEASDVDTVFVAGRPLLLDGKLTTLDEPAILARARSYARQVLESVKTLP